MKQFKEYKLKEIIFQIKKYWKYILVLLSISTCVTLLRYIIPLINMRIIDEGIIKKDICSLSKNVLLYLIVTVFSIALSAILEYFQTKYDQKIEVDLKEIILEFYINLNEQSLEKYTSGEIDTVLKCDIYSVIALIFSIPEGIIINVISFIIAIVVMISLQPILALFIILFQLFAFKIRRKYNIKIEKCNNNERESYVLSNNILSEIICNIRKIRLLNSQEYIINKFRNKMYTNQRYHLKSLISIKLLNSISSILDSSLTCLMLFIGGYMVLKGQITLGTLTTLMQYSDRLCSPIVQLVSLTTDFSSIKNQIVKITNILEASRLNNHFSNKSNLNEIENISSIKINNMEFNYNKKDIFINTSLFLEKGTINYIIGESGIGKSTLIKLILGEYKVDRNMIFFNNKDINDISNLEINTNISWVPQEPVLFNDTIYMNITLGKEYTNYEIEQVCKDCLIYEDIIKSKKGLNTLIDEKGLNFSVGQKQRIALARSILQNKPILILDEPTSSLDQTTAINLKKNIEKYLKNKIVIIITHSKDFIIPKSNIYTIENKQILQVMN